MESYNDFSTEQQEKREKEAFSEAVELTLNDGSFVMS